MKGKLIRMGSYLLAGMCACTALAVAVERKKDDSRPPVAEQSAPVVMAGDSGDAAPAKAKKARKSRRSRKVSAKNADDTSVAAPRKTRSRRAKKQHADEPTSEK